MSAIPWSTIVDAARAAAALLPAPLDVAASAAVIALDIARRALDAGCTLEGCPAAVRAELDTRPIPDAAGPMAAARAKAAKRATGRR